VTNKQQTTNNKQIELPNHHILTQLGVKIKALRDDKGGEYISGAFSAFCDEHGILRQHTTRNRPQQNGVAERANRVMGEAVTTVSFLRLLNSR